MLAAVGAVGPILGLLGGAHAHADEAAVVFKFDPQEVVLLNAVGVGAERDEMLVFLVGEGQKGGGGVALQ